VKFSGSPIMKGLRQKSPVFHRTIPYIADEIMPDFKK
jgi:hypothetical protein